MEYRWQVLFAFDKTRDQNSPSVLDLLNLAQEVAAGIKALREPQFNICSS
jgi:hypothetical protein